MSDFTAAPYRGDPGVPHAREGNFTVSIRLFSSPREGMSLNEIDVVSHSSQALLGGAWAFLGLTFLKDVVEVRPAYKCEALLRRRTTVFSAEKQKINIRTYFTRFVRLQP